jgi:site-specific DNA-methyltransferase (cytosine-N4-specific)
MNDARVSPVAKVQVADCFVLEADVTEALPLLPDASVQCIITSPPYWGLRDYGIRGQIGLEPTHYRHYRRETNGLPSI